MAAAAGADFNLVMAGQQARSAVFAPEVPPAMRLLDKPGDTVEIEISGIGVLRNKVAAGI
jgi:2-keto-4-pentenoate hydratase/2-oxohepta-3-ene-1,7-dioic acid hydratase in catechol pathway